MDASDECNSYNTISLNRVHESLVTIRGGYSSAPGVFNCVLLLSLKNGFTIDSFGGDIDDENVTVTIFFGLEENADLIWVSWLIQM